MAAVVAIGHIRSDRPVFERLYRIVFWLTIVGHLLMLVNRPALLLLAWIGPPRNPRAHVDSLMYLNVLVPLALGFFFSAPWLRTYRKKHGTSPSTAG
jgi:hypothetical protein